MKFFKNHELVALFGVSDKSVRNWIIAAQQGKVRLELCQQNNKVYIADTLQNGPVLNELASRGKKYRNRRSHRTLEPKPLFYQLYGQREVIDIANSLDISGELPFYLRYKADGARYWDAYLEKLYNSGTTNIMSATIELLRLNHDYIAYLASGFNTINVVDIGVGNGLASKALLERLKSDNKIAKYVGIDVSHELLDKTEQNINSWFADKLPVEKHTRELTHECFKEILTSSHNQDEPSSMNLLLFLGGTILNFKEPVLPLCTIRDSMTREDVLVSTLKLDSTRARRFFDFNVQADKAELPPHNKFILDLLNIDESLYEVEQLFDLPSKSRLVRVKLNVSISIRFDTGASHKVVNFAKGDLIQIFRVRHYSDHEVTTLFQACGFDVLQTSHSNDKEYLMVTCRVQARDRVANLVN